MEPARISNQIRRLRFETGEMTQQQLAEHAGVTRQTIVAIEGAKYSPSLELAFRIAAAFRKPLEEVFQFGNGCAPGDSGGTL
ncbi:XRE family transcriptional regulator [Verrucomicrobia bacterium SCGC AG-212-E04]|nr:XRE family transcriptional regulator [Verrucomicrobia bacterium SCGC AG-212-E04]